MVEIPVLYGFANGLCTFCRKNAPVCAHFEKMHKISLSTSRIFYKKSCEKGLRYGNPLYNKKNKVGKCPTTINVFTLHFS